MTKLNLKIISGGATGADEAGLAAAFDLGISTGGTAPKDYRIQLFDGSDSSNPLLKTKYGLEEHKSYEFSPRTVQNVKDSDATVWFGYPYSGGGKLNINSCLDYKKPYIINPSVEELVNFIVLNKIRVLNVAGNILSEFNPDIYEATYQIVYSALSKLKAFVEDD